MVAVACACVCGVRVCEKERERGVGGGGGRDATPLKIKWSLLLRRGVAVRFDGHREAAAARAAGAAASPGTSHVARRDYRLQVSPQLNTTAAYFTFISVESVSKSENVV